MASAERIAESKWITGLTLTLPLRRAALRVLRARLQVVQHYFPLASEKAHEDVEHVHQLRVATRRARAALELFRSTIDEKLHDDLRRHLRRIRRAAGAARDADVMLERLQAQLAKCRDAERPGLHGLAGHLCQAREEAQAELRQAYQAHGAEFDRSVRRCLRALRSPVTTKPPVPLVGGIAGPHLLALLDAFETLAEGDDHTDEALHQVRIAGKQLRYALEIFASCYPAVLREEIYPRVEGLQDVLGELNDARVAQAALSTRLDHLRRMQPAWWKEWRRGLEKLLRTQARRLEASRDAYREAWKEWIAKDVSRQLRELLAPSLANGEARSESPWNKIRDGQRVAP